MLYAVLNIYGSYLMPSLFQIFSYFFYEFSFCRFDFSLFFITFPSIFIWMGNAQFINHVQIYFSPSQSIFLKYICNWKLNFYPSHNTLWISIISQIIRDNYALSSFVGTLSAWMGYGQWAHWRPCNWATFAGAHDITPFQVSFIFTKRTPTPPKV